MSERKLVVHNYEHGGARMYFETENDSDHALASPKRDLIVDCYQDRAFANYIENCVREYFANQGGSDES